KDSAKGSEKRKGVEPSVAAVQEKWFAGSSGAKALLIAKLLSWLKLRPRKTKASPGVRLHFVTTEVLVAEVFEPLAQLVAGTLVRDGGRHFGAFQYLIINIDGAIKTQRQSERIAGARIHRHRMAVALHPDERVERIVSQVGDNHLLDVDVEAGQNVFQEIVRH